MPPLRAQTVKTRARHRALQDAQMAADARIVPIVLQHRGRGEIIEVRRHRHFAPLLIDQGRIDRYAAGVERTDAVRRIRDIGSVLRASAKADRALPSVDKRPRSSSQIRAPAR